MIWTLDQVAAATGGTRIGPVGVELPAVSTDTRTLPPGCLFVALRGDRFDGHDFVAEALGKGAAAVMVDRRAGVTVEPRVEVDDTLTGLRDLAGAARARLALPVVAITGTSGKTGTKDLLGGALGPGAWASPRSYNNEVGVPLTVLAVPDHATALVVEVGSRGAGHIRALMPAVRPHVAIITMVGMAHYALHGSAAATFEAKWELIEGLEPGGVAVLPADDQRMRGRGGRALFFGPEHDADVRIVDPTVDEHGCARFMLHTPWGTAPVGLQVAGLHQARNAAAAAAAALELGTPLADVVAGLERASGSPWRMEVNRGRFTVVNDAYNANPDSMAAALRSVAALGGRRVAVLGMMHELGEAAALEHRRVGELAAALGYAAVVVVGEDPGVAEGAGPIAHSVPDQAAASGLLATLLEAGDVVLVKGSRAVGLERLADRLGEAGA